MIKNKLIYYSDCVERSNIALYKEHGEILYYFSKLFSYDAVLDDYYDKETPTRTKFRTVNLQTYKIRNKFTKILKILNIFRYAHKIDILYLFQITPDTLLKMIAYRLGMGKGKIYVKLDLSIDGYKNGLNDLLILDNMPYYLKVFHHLFKLFPDIYTVELKKMYERLKHTYYGDLIKKDKLFLMPNGFDPEILNDFNITRKSVTDKEKIIITVGRLGTYQKNTELFLSALNKIDLKDWKVYLIGPIDSLFNDKINEFFIKYPEKRNNIVFTGEIAHKELYDYYSRARVFCLTSRSESYAFVLAEAAYMWDYIITTNVGIAEDFSEYNIPEYVCKDMDDSEFSKELQRIINMNEEELNHLVPENNLSEITWENIMKNNKGMLKLAQSVTND